MYYLIIWSRRVGPVVSVPSSRSRSLCPFVSVPSSRSRHLGSIVSVSSYRSRRPGPVNPIPSSRSRSDAIVSVPSSRLHLGSVVLLPSSVPSSRSRRRGRWNGDDGTETTGLRRRDRADLTEITDRDDGTSYGRHAADRSCVIL